MLPRVFYTATLLVYVLISWRFVRENIPSILEGVERNLKKILNCPTEDLVRNMAGSLRDAFLLPSIIWIFWFLIAGTCLYAISSPDSPPLNVLIVFAVISFTSPLCLALALLYALYKRSDEVKNWIEK